MKKLNKTQNAIGALVLFCTFLLLLRVQYTQSLFFSFLLWNLFLAVIPYVISEGIKKYQPKKFKLYFLLFVWLLFLPNSPYIITDFVHLHHTKSNMLWYDIFMLFSFANTGLLLALISMNDVYKIIRKEYSKLITNRFIISVTLLCGFGVYLGRFLRFNSWDMFTNPLSVIKKSLSSLTNTTTWFITIGFASLLWFLLLVFRNFSSQKTTI